MSALIDSMSVLICSIVTVALFIGAAVLAMMGKKKFAAVQFVPTESIEQIKTEDGGADEERDGDDEGRQPRRDAKAHQAEDDGHEEKAEAEDPQEGGAEEHGR